MMAKTQDLALIYVNPYFSSLKQILFLGQTVGNFSHWHGQLCSLETYITNGIYGYKTILMISVSKHDRRLVLVRSSYIAVQSKPGQNTQRKHHHEFICIFFFVVQFVYLKKLHTAITVLSDSTMMKSGRQERRKALNKPQP